jgi:hypothetical protein
MGWGWEVEPCQDQYETSGRVGHQGNVKSSSYILTATKLQQKGWVFLEQSVEACSHLVGMDETWLHEQDILVNLPLFLALRRSVFSLSLTTLPMQCPESGLFCWPVRNSIFCPHAIALIGQYQGMIIFLTLSKPPISEKSLTAALKIRHYVLPQLW